jgi:hypothetical protein
MKIKKRTMAHKKYTLIKDFGTQKAGGSVIISENQVAYFIEEGLIEGEKKKKKKTKTKTKEVEANNDEDTIKENNNIIKE